MVAPRRALVRSSSPDDGSAQAAGPTPYTTGDVLALLLELGAIEHLRVTEEPAAEPSVVEESQARGRAVDRYL